MYNLAVPKILIHLNHSYNYQHLFFLQVENEVVQQPFHTISNLMPSRAYCLKVQAFTRAYNKSGQFSNVICTETLSGMKSLNICLVYTIPVACSSCYNNSSAFFVTYSKVQCCHSKDILHML